MNILRLDTKDQIERAGLVVQRLAASRSTLSQNAYMTIAGVESGSVPRFPAALLSEFRLCNSSWSPLLSRIGGLANVMGRLFWPPKP